MRKGFTLVELLAVIVILAIIALIATPVVLGIINNSRESARLRSAEFYLDAVEQAIMKQNLNTVGETMPSECEIVANGNLNCDEETINVEVDGEVPDSGVIMFEKSTISNVSLVYGNDTIVFNEDGKLDYQ